MRVDDVGEATPTPVGLTRALSIHTEQLWMEKEMRDNSLRRRQAKNHTKRKIIRRVGWKQALT